MTRYAAIPRMRKVVFDRIRLFPSLAGIGLAGLVVIGVTGFIAQPDASSIDIWAGDMQRIGHLGDAQDDFNLIGHVRDWRELDRLTWSPASMPQEWVPLSFRAYRRLAEDGDFNADIPIQRLKPGTNEVVISAYFRDGRTEVRTVKVKRESGDSPLPVRIRWRHVGRPQDVGQIVDGRWRLENGRLRTAQVGYDRIFLVGNRRWRDYEVRTSILVHAVAPPDEPSLTAAATVSASFCASPVTRRADRSPLPPASPNSVICRWVGSPCCDGRGACPTDLRSCSSIPVTAFFDMGSFR